MHYYSVVIPTMWRSDLLLKMLPEYESCDLVKEIIIIDNDPERSRDISQYTKATKYTKGYNIYVNPAWNWGRELANYELILANDDIHILNLRDVLSTIALSDYDIIGIRVSDRLLEIAITDISNNRFPANSYGCFMFVRNYTMIPDELKIYRGDYYLFMNAKKKGLLRGFSAKIERSKTIRSNLSCFRRICHQDMKIYARLKQEGKVP